MKHFSPTQLSEHIGNPDSNPFLLDVREPWEYDICSIESSISMPMGTIPENIDDLDQSREIIVICHHGIRSKQVAMFLEHKGFTDVVNLTGGIDAWARDIDINMSLY